MTALWDASEIYEALNSDNACDATANWQAQGVSIDSRSLQKGDVFIAIIGENSDGHGYLNQAVENGAVAAIVNYIPENFSAKMPLIVVEDSFEALYEMARFSRARTKAKIIGVTGSVGKTSVKEMLHQALSRQGKTYATEGNLNNHYGVPLSLCRMSAQCDYGIFEMGMSAPDEISPLSVLVNPDVVIITTVDTAHLEFFDSVEDIADAKAEIFDGAKASATAILNRDNSHFLRLRNHAADKPIRRIVSFGLSTQADFRLMHYQDSEEGGHIKAICGGVEREYTLGIHGSHQAKNSLAVLAAVQAVGGDVKQAAASFAGMSSGKGRGQSHHVKVVFEGESFAVTLIDDSYNASPASIKAGFELLEKRKIAESHTRSVAVLGDMFELGKDAEELHQLLAEDIKKHCIDGVITIGNLMESLHHALPDAQKIAHFSTSDEAAKAILPLLHKGDIILVKGSRGMKTDIVVDTILGM